MKHVAGILFLLLCAVQWYVPGQMIARQEKILHDGKVFRFRTAPIDPSDPFRGRYITLDFEADIFHKQADPPWRTGEPVFVLLENDSNGFVRVSDVSRTLPAPTTDFVTAEVGYPSHNGLSIRYPFERFYLEESKAPAAETVYRDRHLDSASTVYAVVRIMEGTPALEAVMINDSSIVDIVRRLNRAR